MHVLQDDPIQVYLLRPILRKAYRWTWPFERPGASAVILSPVASASAPRYEGIERAAEADARLDVGPIFESLPYHNLVCVGFDEKNTPRYASYRCLLYTSYPQRFHQTASGALPLFPYRILVPQLHQSAVRSPADRT